MFQRSLQDLVKGIRNHKRDPVGYLSKEIGEIRKELKSTDLTRKYVAVQKLTYLHMIGYNASWASFHIVEVMSSSKFAHQRAGMLAASQTFTEDTDVLLLCTNLLKKQIQSKVLYESGTALSCLSNVATRELSRDLLDDVTPMLNSSKPYLRKKAILVLYKLYLKYPQGLKLTYERLRQRLNDTDMSVVSCAVNVICELSRKNPNNFLPLAPQLFNLLTTSSNNWMLIKVVKLLAALLVEEPRLARKLLEPLLGIIESTEAKSLLYECVKTATIALKYTRRSDGTQPALVPQVVQVCTARLREFVQEADENLKYLGLVGLVELMHSHPGVVAEHKELVLRCLLDQDITVRLRALELLTGMVTKRNLVDIVQKLLEHVHLAEGTYRDELIAKIVFVCSRDKYAYLTNFPWYISVLIDLGRLNGTPKSRLIRDQLLDVALRVPSVRGFAVNAMIQAMEEVKDACFRVVDSGQSGGKRVVEMKEFSQMGDLVYACAWTTCEYIKYSSEEGVEAFAHKLESLLDVMFHAKTKELACEVQCVLLHAALKLVAKLAKACAGDNTGRESLVQFSAIITKKTLPFSHSHHIRTEQTAKINLSLLASLGLIPPTEERLVKLESQALPGDHQVDVQKISSSLTALFAEEFRPVSDTAQEKVPIPEGLDLDQSLLSVSFAEALGVSEESIDTGRKRGALAVSFSATPAYSEPEETPMLGGMTMQPKEPPPKNGKATNVVRDKRTEAFYLSARREPRHLAEDEEDLLEDDLMASGIPIVKLEDGVLGKVERDAETSPVEVGASVYERLPYMSQQDFDQPVAVLTEEAMPEGATENGRSLYTRRRQNKNAEEEELTLADIDVTKTSDDGKLCGYVHRCQSKSILV